MARWSVKRKTDREVMIERLKQEIAECQRIENKTWDDCREVSLLMFGARNALQVVLGWYDEIAADGKPIFRK